MSAELLSYDESSIQQHKRPSFVGKNIATFIAAISVLLGSVLLKGTDNGEDYEAAQSVVLKLGGKVDELSKELENQDLTLDQLSNIRINLRLLKTATDIATGIPSKSITGLGDKEYTPSNVIRALFTKEGPHVVGPAEKEAIQLGLLDEGDLEAIQVGIHEDNREKELALVTKEVEELYRVIDRRIQELLLANNESATIATVVNSGGQ